MVFQDFYDILAEHPLKGWLETIPGIVDWAMKRNSNMPKWEQALLDMPQITAKTIDLQADTVVIGTPQECTEAQQKQLRESLEALHPWRKGPFSVFGIHIDTEWRSDWKWQRLIEHIQPLERRLVLDIGCGSGYHCLRMAGEKAELVIGVDPYALYIMQFKALSQLAGNLSNTFVLPLTLEDLPPTASGVGYFDSIFSMGIIYHRRSPIDHLLEIRALLREKGELILETIIADGPEGYSLMPPGRYARMRNVWFLPSPATVISWLKRCGYKNARVIHECTTTTEEQRRTPWMKFESLEEFLDKDNPNITVEGLPRPKRAIFLANR